MKAAQLMSWNRSVLRQVTVLGRNGNSLFESAADVQRIVDPKNAVESAGLRYVSDMRRGIARRKVRKGFTYTATDGSRLTGIDALIRFKSLAIPPAWTDVWICPFAEGYIQATGRDAKDRKQYRYHPRFREVRESAKYEHAIAFAEALPAIRAKVREHTDAAMRWISAVSSWTHGGLLRAEGSDERGSPSKGKYSARLANVAAALSQL